MTSAYSLPSDQSNEPCTPSSNSDSEQETVTTNSILPLKKSNIKIRKQNKKKKVPPKPINNAVYKASSHHSKSASYWRKRSHKTTAITDDLKEEEVYNPPRYFKGFRDARVYGVIFSRRFRHQIIKLIHIDFQNKAISIHKMYDLILPMINQYEMYHNKEELAKYSLFRLFINWCKKKVLNKDKELRFRTGIRFNREYHKVMLYAEQDEHSVVYVTRTSTDYENKKEIQKDITHKEIAMISDINKDIVSEDEKCIEEMISTIEIEDSVHCDDYKEIESAESMNTVEFIKDVNQDKSRLNDIDDDYQNSEHLKEREKHYEFKYQQLKNTEYRVNEKRVIYIEMEMGSIVPMISSNTKSILKAFKKFKKVLSLNHRYCYSLNERKYALSFLTKLILNDNRIIAAESHKFAMAQFITLILEEYGDEYLEIYKSIFHHQCIWTLPFVDKSVIYEFDPSIKRCKLLKYIKNKDPDNIEFEDFVYWQCFSDDDVFEDESKYFIRNESLCCLYGSVICYTNSAVDCWRWIASLLCLPQSVYPELLCILIGVLSIVGNMMLTIYPTQFGKVLMYINDNIYSKCDDSTSIRAKTKREWNVFWNKIKESNDNDKLIFKISKSEHSTLIKQSMGARALKSRVDYDYV